MSEPAPRTRPGWHWPALGLALVVTALVYFNIEWVEIRTDQGPSVEALRNPYLAADLYLTRLGVQVERESRLDDVADTLRPDDALVMTTSRATLGPAELEALLRWVDSGGQVVVLALNEYDPATYGGADPLLDHLGVRLVAVEGDDPPMNERMTDLVGTVADSEAFCHLGAEPSDVYVDEDLLKVQFATHQALEFDGEVVGAAANTAGDQLLQIGHGEGRITVLTTTAMWRNSLIRCHDNAHLLGVLLGAAATVWWLAGVEMPALYELLWRHFPYTLLAGAVALLLWAWHRAFRFGAVHGVLVRPRRSLLEHVRAGAAFYWGRGRGDDLLAFLRADVLAHAAGDPRSPLLGAAAARAGVSAEQLARALDASQPPTREAFLTCVQVLQRLRRVL